MRRSEVEVAAIQHGGALGLPSLPRQTETGVAGCLGGEQLDRQWPAVQCGQDLGQGRIVGRHARGDVEQELAVVGERQAPGLEREPPGWAQRPVAAAQRGEEREAGDGGQAFQRALHRHAVELPGGLEIVQDHQGRTGRQRRLDRQAQGRVGGEPECRTQRRDEGLVGAGVVEGDPGPARPESGDHRAGAGRRAGERALAHAGTAQDDDGAARVGQGVGQGLDVGVPPEAAGRRHWRAPGTGRGCRRQYRCCFGRSRASSWVPLESLDDATYPGGDQRQGRGGVVPVAQRPQVVVGTLRQALMGGDRRALERQGPADDREQGGAAAALAAEGRRQLLRHAIAGGQKARRQQQHDDVGGREQVADRRVPGRAGLDPAIVEDVEPAAIDQPTQMLENPVAP